MKWSGIFRNNLRIIVMAVLFMFIIIIGIWTYFYLRTSTQITITVAPVDAVVKIGKKTYKNGTHPIAPGKYSVEISMKDFTTYKGDVTVGKGETAEIYTILDRIDGSTDWKMEEKNSDALMYVADKRYDLLDSYYQSKYPLIKILPIVVSEYSADYSEYTEYRIYYGSSPAQEDAIAIFITDKTGGNEESARDLIRSRGYDPDLYEIIYKYEPVNNL